MVLRRIVIVSLYITARIMDTKTEKVPIPVALYIDRTSSTPTYQQLCDQITQWILSDQLQIGEYLPTENEICKLSGLSRMTVRKAIEKLNQMGLVNAVRGRGTFVVAKEPTAPVKTSIGFVLRPHRYIEEDPFYSQVLMGVTQEAQRRRIHLAFVSGEYIEDETHSYEHYQILQHLAGIIIAGQMPKDFLDHIERIRIPCVFLNYRSSEYPFDTVTADQEEIGKLLGDHLASLGHRRCLYLSGEADNVAYEARLKGFQETFLSHSRSLTVLKGGKDVESGRRMIQQALANGTSFTAVTGGNDTIAIGAMNELLDSGYRIPEEISVCGIDDVPFAENCRPALTTVRIEKQEMGIKALQYLLERLKNPRKVQVTVLLGVKLCARQSTGPVNSRTAAERSTPSRREMMHAEG